MSIYQEIILDHYHNPHNRGSLSQPTKTIAVSNLLCGDQIEMDLQIKDSMVEAVMFRGQGCAISMASASLLTDYVKGKSVTDLAKMPKEFVLELLGVELSPNRLKCAWLSWEALMKLMSG